ncbi:MAG: DUF421 domain-containing protein [Lachnospiraceae bacterium]|nr:DUF421 domain-containing protein [Lachnospiraceae bacterium]
MNLIYIVLLSLFSILVLFTLTKLIGYRQMSEMSMFDYISGITIGSIAAEMATSLENNFLEPLIAMIVYGLVTTLLAFVTSKNMKLRRMISGSPFILLNNDQLYEENFKKGHIDLSEFLVQCRINGYFDLSQIQTAILEENGKISFLPKAAQRPLTPHDMNLDLSEETLLPTYIMDGHILQENLHHSGKDETWLFNQLKAHGCNKPSEVFLATGNQNNALNVYQKNNLGGNDVIKE